MRVSGVKARDERKTAKTRTREQRQETTGVHRDGEEMEMEMRGINIQGLYARLRLRR